MIARSLARGAALAVGALLMLSGCGVFDREVKPPCPRVGILGDAATMIQFRPGAGRDLTDVEFEAEIIGFTGDCEFRNRNAQAVVTVNVQIVGARGPAAKGDSMTVPFFVAIVDRDQRILARETFASKIDFPAGRRRAGVAEEMEQKIPIPADRRSSDFEILIGLQLGQAQLDYNRQKRGF